MKRVALAFLGMLLCAIGAWAFDEADLNLVSFRNLTSETIEFIFLSPGDSDYWGPEILGSERVLGAGDSLGFYILYPDACNTFDILAVGESGDTFVRYDYEICDEAQEVIELVNKDLTDDPPDMEFVTVRIRNDTLPLYYVFISPDDSTYWGVDYLDENTILDMDEEVSFLFPVPEEVTTYALMAVDEEGDEYRFSFDIDAESDDDLYAVAVSDLYVE